MIEVNQLSWQVKNRQILHSISFTVQPQEFVVIMGPNGAGKSSLLKLLTGIDHSYQGSILLEGKPVHQYTRMQLAVKCGVLSQHYHIPFPISVQELVSMGRYPYFGQRLPANDEAIVTEAMSLMDVHQLAGRDYHTLSGGEAQKVQMSRVLAQIWDAGAGNEKLLFLDEPVASLDIKYQHQLLQIARGRCKQHTTVIAILHDINLALKYADRILLMKNGQLKHDLRQSGQLTPMLIKEIFDLETILLSHPHHGLPVAVF